MRDLSTLAKLLAEEDIHVIHRNQPTAMFDVKNRELSLPIWKEMSKNVQDLMTLHEVGHALWTPLDMLETAKKEKIEFSFVNVLEDVRIEKMIQDKYLGSVRTFKKGYDELISKDFENYFDSPSICINFITFCKKNDLNFKEITIEEFIKYLISFNIYKKDNFIKNNIKYYVELFFMKKAKKISNNEIFDLVSYFNKKFNLFVKYNLDLESFFLEFRSKLLNE